MVLRSTVDRGPTCSICPGQHPSPPPLPLCKQLQHQLRQSLCKSTLLCWFTLSKDVACPHCLANWSPGQYYPRDSGQLCTGSGYMLQLIALQRNPHRPYFSAPWNIGVVFTISYLLMQKIIPSCFILDVGVAENALGTFLRQLKRKQNIHGSLSSILCWFSGLGTLWYHWDLLGHREGWVWDPMNVLSSSSSRVFYPAVLSMIWALPSLQCLCSSSSHLWNEASLGLWR